MPKCRFAEDVLSVHSFDVRNDRHNDIPMGKQGNWEREVAKVLFLHGWRSTVGGVKPTFLRDAGHTVFNPQLNDDDFNEAVHTSQTEFGQHKPHVIVGSSRGGAVAMNIDTNDTPLVLLCPAWKKWGNATTVKPNTIILHSRQDDVIRFSDSEELVMKSGLPSSALIEVGTDHRLADSIPLKAMLAACENVIETKLRKYIGWLRASIDVAKTKDDDLSELNKPARNKIKNWPKDCCDTQYVFFLLYELGFRGLIRKCADVSHYGDGFNRHVWIVVDGITVDITADQFPDVTEKVIVTRHSPWHENLKTIEVGPWAPEGEDQFYGQYRDRSGELFTYFFEVLLQYVPHPNSV